MISIETLEKWLCASVESEHLEFKKASQQYNLKEVLKYCAAMSNEGGGHLVLGVTNTPPRKITGTRAFLSAKQLNKLKLTIFDQLHIRVDTDEITHPDGRVLIFTIPSRPVAQPLDLNGRYLMRTGESVVAMPPDRLKEIFAENTEDWFAQMAMEGINAEDVITLLSTQTYFDLLDSPYPDTPSAVLHRLEEEGFVQGQSGKWGITNLGVILLANDINKFPQEIARKAVRFVLYDGTGKTKTRKDIQELSGYAVKFESLVNYVNDEAPHNYILEETVRKEYRMFPKQALRELIANALIHQDFSVTGASVMIEMYTDRVEISNPGKPIIGVDRFIDGYKSRNEKLADIMRRFGFCEEKGSGIDKVIQQVEVYQLPAPDFRNDEIRTIATLFAHQDFSDMSKNDRIRACYQHCCLLYVGNQRMTNSTLRKRFQVTEKQMATVSLVITATRKKNLIKIDESETRSLRYVRYLPFWG